MTAVFERYAGYYDLLYRDKDYDAECELVDRLLRKHAPAPPRNVLDVGCGTGGHALPLARRGYQVTGVDLSAEMLRDAGRKATELGVRVRFVQGDMRGFKLDGRFDAAICMFAALGYQLTNDDVTAALTTIRRHLLPGAPFFFDVWNGLAVLRILPEQRVKVVESDGLRLVRAVSPRLDTAAHVCHDDYRLLVLEGETLVDEVVESHAMRFFFPQELDQFLERAGFRVARMSPFPDDGRRIDETSWNMSVLAIATEES